MDEGDVELSTGSDVGWFAVYVGLVMSRWVFSVRR
jgi:hypothetical protein